MYLSGRDRRNTNPVNLVVWIAFPAEATMNVRKAFYYSNKNKNATLGRPGTEDEPNKFMAVNAWAPVFANREGVNLARAVAGSLANEKCHVYTSLNAARLTDTNGEPFSQAAFEAQHILLGVTTDGSQITLGDPAQEEERVGVTVHGLMSIRNWGWHTFSPGMHITYKLPSVNSEIRAAQTAKRIKAMTKDCAGHEEDMSPILFEWQPYQEYVSTATTGVSVFLGPIVQGSVPDYSKESFMGPSGIRLPVQADNEVLEMGSLGMEIAKMSQSFGLTFLAVLLERGEVVPRGNFPSNFDYLTDLCERLFGSADRTAQVDKELALDVLSAQLGSVYLPYGSAANGSINLPMPEPIFGQDVPAALENLRTSVLKMFLEITGRLHGQAAGRLIGRAAGYARAGDQMPIYK